MTTVKINNELLTDNQLLLVRVFLRDMFMRYTDGCLKGSDIFHQPRARIFELMQVLDGVTKELSLDNKDGSRGFKFFTVNINGVDIGSRDARYIGEATRMTMEDYAQGKTGDLQDHLDDFNQLINLTQPHQGTFPRYPQLPNLVAVDDPAYEYRDMRQSDLSVIHIEGPASDNEGWRRETMEMVGATGRMKRKKPLTIKAALCIHEFDRALTVRELKRIIANWPVKNRFGDDCEVWISNGDGLSSAVTSIWPLNAESTADGEMITADLMLQPYELTASRTKPN